MRTFDSVFSLLSCPTLSHFQPYLIIRKQVWCSTLQVKDDMLALKAAELVVPDSPDK